MQIPGHNVWPMKLVTELYYQAYRKSLSSNFSLHLHTNTPVTSVTPINSDTSSSSRHRWNVHTPRGSVTCNVVLHATNGYASHLLPHMTGPEGIIPTRGQIIGTRANVSASELTRSGWGGNDGFEYWFPRPVKLKSEGEENEEKPLVILGGGREVSKPKFELYETDDSVINTSVGHALRAFLPAVFPGKFDKKQEPEWQWVRPFPLLFHHVFS